jgi:hypothetical protein
MKKLELGKKINLVDIPKYSNLLEKIIYSTQSDIKYKNISEVLREYEDERWGLMLKKISSKKFFSLEYLESLHVDKDVRCVSYEDGNFFLRNEAFMLEKHKSLYIKTISKYVKYASSIVELGAGFGSKIVSIAKNYEFKNLSFYAGEYTNSGQSIIKKVAINEGVDIKVGYCDLRKLEISGMDIPKNSIIFTSYAAHYVPQILDSFVNFFDKFKPLVVIHFEPFYEHHEVNNAYGILCKKYIELNDYSRNLQTVIENGCKKLNYKLIVNKNVLGSNPFLPISVVEWTK